MLYSITSTLAISSFLSYQAMAAPMPSASSSSAAATATKLPICDASYAYRNPNPKLEQATQDEAGIISEQAQMTGASAYILGYSGWGDMVPGTLDPITKSLNTMWIPQLSSPTIKCAACVNSTGAEKHNQVQKFPVLVLEDLFNIFDVSTNLLAALEENQCDVDGYTPSTDVQTAVGAYVKAMYAAMGTGPTVGEANGLGDKVPAGAVLPYYECLATHASNSSDFSSFQSMWFPMIEALQQISTSACMPQ